MNKLADQSLKGRTALVTGASRGLGKVMAAALGRAGARVALVARDEAKLRETQLEVQASGSEAVVLVADVAEERDVERLDREVRERLGSVDILINNAGMNIRKKATDFTLNEWNRVMQTNLTSVFLMCRAFVPHMRGRGYGRVINMTSIMSHVSMPERAAYSASKAGLLGYTKALALELAPDRITVTAISPGPFATEMNLPLMNNPELNAQFVSKIPVGTWGPLDDIGALAVFLCSENAGFITGTDILIDGGWCAQ